MIRWTTTPLRKIGESGIYAKSEDRRFLILARRWRHGEPGERKYTYFYSAVDYALPSDGRRYTEIPVGGGGSRGDLDTMNADKAFEAVERWAEEHPLE